MRVAIESAVPPCLQAWLDGVLDLSDERLAARSGTLNLIDFELNYLDLNPQPLIVFHSPPIVLPGGPRIPPKDGSPGVPF